VGDGHIHGAVGRVMRGEQERQRIRDGDLRYALFPSLPGCYFA
jgi:hypothetical protein